MRKIATSAYHPNGNGGVECVNHTMAQMLAVVCTEIQNDWDILLPQVEFAYENSASTATGLAPNEVHMNRLPRHPSPYLNNTTPGYPSTVLYGGPETGVYVDLLVAAPLDSRLSPLQTADRE